MIRLKDWPETLTVREAAECTGLGRDYCYQMFRRPDFPLANPGARRNKRVGRAALWEYINGRYRDDTH